MDNDDVTLCGGLERTGEYFRSFLSVILPKNTQKCESTVIECVGCCPSPVMFFNFYEYFF